MAENTIKKIWASPKSSRTPEVRGDVAREHGRGPRRKGSALARRPSTPHFATARAMGLIFAVRS